MNCDKIRATYSRNGVFLAPPRVLPHKGFCAACVRELAYCCRCADPDFCVECFDFYKDGILKSTGHTDKKGVPFKELVV